ncbi:hypothetical protein [Acinetobacter sp. AHP123]
MSKALSGVIKDEKAKLAEFIAQLRKLKRIRSRLLHFNLYSIQFNL